MKLIHLKNLKRECVLVELANTESHPRIIPAMGTRRIFYSDQYGLDGLSSIDLDRPVKLIGHFPSLTEQEFEGVVHEPQYGYYFNYNYDTPAHKWVRNARESFLSYLESEGWYVNGNPNGKNRPRHNQYASLIQYQGDAKEWDEAQEKVIDLSRCYLFIKI